MFRTLLIVHPVTLLWILQTMAKSSGRHTSASGPWGVAPTSLSIRGGAAASDPSTSPPSVEPRPKKKRKKKHPTKEHHQLPRDELLGKTSSAQPIDDVQANLDNALTQSKTETEAELSEETIRLPGSGTSDVKETDANSAEKIRKGRRKHRGVRKKRRHTNAQTRNISEDLIEKNNSSPLSLPKKKKKVKKKRSSKPLKADTHTSESRQTNATNFDDIVDAVAKVEPLSSLPGGVNDENNNSSPESGIIPKDSAIFTRDNNTDDADHLGLGVDGSGPSDSEGLPNLTNVSVSSEGVVVMGNDDASALPSPQDSILDIAINPSISSSALMAPVSFVENVNVSVVQEENTTKDEEIPGDDGDAANPRQETLNQETGAEENITVSTADAEKILSDVDTDESHQNANTTIQQDDEKDDLTTDSKEVSVNEDSSESSGESSSDETNLKSVMDQVVNATSSKEDQAPGIDASTAPVPPVVSVTNTSSSTKDTGASTSTSNYPESSNVGSESKAVNEAQLENFPEPLQTTAPPVTVNLQELVKDADSEDDLHVSIVTWNLAEESPEEDDTQFIRSFRNHGVDKKGSDFVLISGQECENIKPRRSEGRRSREFRRLMVKQLGKRYVPIAIHQLGGIQFGLFCRRSIIGDVESVSVADVTCGIGNVFHNKGAIAAFVKLRARNKRNREQQKAKSLKMLFVTAHMAAHVKNFEARDADYWRIMTELEAQAPPSFLMPSHGVEAPGGTTLVDTADRVFFCGDLNYRMDLPREIAEHAVHEIKEHAEKKESKSRLLVHRLRSKLLIYDQLLCTMAAGRAFNGLVEGKIKFLPTFKYDKHSDDFDTSHKQRIPAWTDRILFKPVGTRVLEYDSYVDAKHSDHRPVFATFRVNAEGRPQPRKSIRKKRSGKKKLKKSSQKLD